MTENFPFKIVHGDLCGKATMEEIEVVAHTVIHTLFFCIFSLMKLCKKDEGLVIILSILCVYLF